MRLAYVTHEQNVARFYNLFTSLLNRAWPPKTRVQNVRKEDDYNPLISMGFIDKLRSASTLKCPYKFETPVYKNLPSFTLLRQSDPLKWTRLFANIICQTYHSFRWQKTTELKSNKIPKDNSNPNYNLRWIQVSNVHQLMTYNTIVRFRYFLVWPVASAVSAWMNFNQSTSLNFQYCNRKFTNVSDSRLEWANLY